MPLSLWFYYFFYLKCFLPLSHKNHVCFGLPLPPWDLAQWLTQSWCTIKFYWVNECGKPFCHLRFHLHQETVFDSINYNRALAKSTTSDWITRALASASVETEPCAAAAAELQRPWGSSGWSEALCSRESGATGLWIVEYILGTDFMIPILAPHI